MMMSFTVREGYEGIGGVVGYGSGQVLNVRDELDKSAGGDVIRTDNPHLQQVLSEFRGRRGHVFDVATIIGGEETPVPRDAPPPPKPTRTPAEAAADVMSAVAQHGEDQSGYGILPIEELQKIAAARNINVSADATKPDIIALIEQHDAAAAAGTGA